MKRLARCSLRAGTVLGASLGLIAGSAPAGAVGSAPPTARSVSPGWQLRSSGSGLGYLSSVVALGPGNVWAAGASTPAGKPPAALVMRWDGARWSKVAITQPAVFGPATVAASAATNVWVFSTLGQSDILRWDGVRWHRVPVPSGYNSGESSPVVLSPSNVWMYGVTFNPPHVTGCLTTIWHWNGRGWASHPVTGFCATSMSASSWRNVWLAGTQGLPSPTSPRKIEAFRWIRQSWRPASMPHPYEYASGYTLPEVVAASASSIWIGDDQRNSSFSQQMGPGFALHWNGLSWTQTPSSVLATNQGITRDGHGGLWMGPDGHWTARAWDDTTPGPAFGSAQSYAFAALANVPGSSTIWGVGSISRSGGMGPMIASYGPIP